MLELNQLTTSTYCGSQACVGVKLLPTGGVAILDTKPDGGTLALDVEGYRSFVDVLKRGEFDRG